MSQPEPVATAAGRGSIAYEPCPQDGHSHDWRDCPTPEDWATTTAAVLARIIAPHNRDLDPDYHEWITLGERVRADRIGRPNARVMVETWQLYRCNNPDCPGEAIVSDYNAVFAIEEAESGT